MTFLSVNFLVSFFSLSEARLKLSVLYLLGHVIVGSFFLSVTWYDITYDTGNERWQVTESGKIMCLGPHWFMLQFLSSCVHLFFSFRDELGLVDSLSTLGFLNKLLNEAGCWVKCSLSTGFPNRDYFFTGLKILLSNFSKKTTAEFDLGFHSIYFWSFLLLHLVSNF